MKRLFLLISLMFSFLLVAVTCSADVVRRKDLKPSGNEKSEIRNATVKEKLKQVLISS